MGGIWPKENLTDPVGQPIFIAGLLCQQDIETP